MRAAIPVLCLAALAATKVAWAEIIDRVAVRVGTVAIAESDIVREIRLTAFLNREQPVLNGETKRKAAERLVDQRLFRKEIEMGRYPAPEPEAVDRMLQTVLAGRSDSFDPKELRAHVEWQLATVRFITLRFGAGIRIAGEEIEKYYRERVAPKLGADAPPAAAYRAQIEQALKEEQANVQAEAWLKQARERTIIEFRKEAFQ
jgi:hypothetical protein